VIFAVIESLDDVPPIGGLEFALAGGATATANASAERTATTSLRIVSLLGVRLMHLPLPPPTRTSAF
jgi:hypothetical protein